MALLSESSWIRSINLRSQQNTLREKIAKLRDQDSMLSNALMEYAEGHYDLDEEENEESLKLFKSRLQKCHKCLEYLWAQKVIDDYQQRENENAINQ